MNGFSTFNDTANVCIAGFSFFFFSSTNGQKSNLLCAHCLCLFKFKTWSAVGRFRAFYLFSTLFSAELCTLTAGQLWDSFGMFPLNMQLECTSRCTIPQHMSTRCMHLPLAYAPSFLPNSCRSHQQGTEITSAVSTKHEIIYELFEGTFTITICQMSPSYCSQRYFEPKCISLPYSSYSWDQSGRNELASRQFFMSCHVKSSKIRIPFVPIPFRSVQNIKSQASLAILMTTSPYFNRIFSGALQSWRRTARRLPKHAVLSHDALQILQRSNDVQLLACLHMPKKSELQDLQSQWPKTTTKKMKQKHKNN